jgi:hypoxanthine phosphoribosyltransferase
MPTSREEVLKQPKVLIPEVKIQARLAELAQEINHDYRDKEVTAICILKGSFVFFSDLIRRFEFPMTCEFLGVSNYPSKLVSSGEVKITLDINEPLENKHVIVFDDLVDSGLTLSYIMNTLQARRPASLKSCGLLLKQDNLRTEIDINYLGFKIGREFVVGYGIDFSGQFRGLPYVGYIEHGH